MSLHFPGFPITIKSYHYHETSPSQRLFQALISRGIIDHEGNLLASKETAFISGTNFHELVKKFWDTEKTIKIPKTDIHETEIEVKFKLHELIDYLVSIEPNISLDIMEQTALNFLGFDFVEQLYRHWNIDLVEVCGPEYVEQLKRELNSPPSIKRELNSPPSIVNILYGTKQTDAEKVNNLVRGVIDFLGSKISDSDISKLNEKLNDKTGTYYQHWLNTIHHFNLIPRIAVEEFIAKNTIYSKHDSLHPFGGLAFTLDDGSALDLRFCDFYYWIDLCHKSNKARLPFKKMDSVSEAENFLKDYYDGYIRGVINLTCRKRISSKLHTLTSKTSNELFLGTIKGETASLKSDKLKLIEWLLHESQKDGLASGRPAGVSLGVFLNNSLPENLSNKEFFALVLNFCELFSEALPPNELNNLITVTSERWQRLAFQDDGSIFFPLAKAVMEKTSYEVISAYLKMCANSLLKKPQNIRAWRNETSCPYGYKGIVQLEIAHGESPLYLNIENHQNLINIFDYNLRSNPTSLALFTNRILNKSELADTLTFENVHFENFEMMFPQLLEKFLNHSALYPVNTKEYFKQLCLFLNSQNSCLSQEEKIELKKLLLHVEQNEDLNSEEIITLLLQFFGTCKSNIIPNAIYKFFKTTNSSRLKIESIKSLAQTDLLYAIRAFNKLIHAPHYDQFPLEPLLEEIMTAFEKHPNSLLYIDMLSKELESILKSRIKFNSVNWLREQLILADKSDLAALIHLENKETSVTTSPKENEKVWDVESLCLEADVILNSNSPHWAKAYGTLLQTIHKNKTLKIDKHLWWEKFILPALELAKRDHWHINCDIQIHAINSLKAYPPNRETFEKLCEYFIDFLRQVTYKQSFPTILKNAILKNIDFIFENMQNYELYRQMVDLAYEISPHGWLKVSDSLLNAFSSALKESTESSRKIHELINEGSLKEKWSELKNAPGLFAQLCLIYAKKGSPIAFDYFDKCDNYSPELFGVLLDLCGTLQNGTRFSEINEKRGSISDKKLIETWKNCFSKVLSNLNEKNIIALSKIILSQNSHLLDHEIIVRLLKNISPMVPYFNKVLTCLLNILNKNSNQSNGVQNDAKIPSKKRSSKKKPATQHAKTIDEILFVETLSLIKFTRDKKLISKAFHLIKNRKLSLENSKSLWNTLIEKISFLDESCLTEILKTHSQIPAFDLNASESLNNFASLFKAYEDLLINDHEVKNKRDLKPLVNAYKFIATSKAINIDSNEFQKVQLIYAHILSISTGQAEALQLLIEILKNYFTKNNEFIKYLKNSLLSASLSEIDISSILSLCEKEKGREWNSDLVFYFTKIIQSVDKTIFNKDDLLFIYSTLSTNFNLDAFIHFANKVNKIKSEDSQEILFQIVSRLMTIQNFDNKKQLIKLKKLVNRIDLKKQLENMIYNNVLNEPLNVFKILFSTNVNKFLTKKDITNLKFQFLENYFTNVSNKGNDDSSFIIIHCCLDTFDELIKENKIHANRLIINIIKTFYQLLSENSISVNDYEDISNKINNVWTMWTIQDEKIKFENNFYLFLTSCLNAYHKNSDKQYFDCLNFLVDKLKLGMKSSEKIDTQLYSAIAKVGIKLFGIRNKFEEVKELLDEELPDFTPIIDEFSSFFYDKSKLPPVCELYKYLLTVNNHPKEIELNLAEKHENKIFANLYRYLKENPSKFSAELALLLIKTHLPEAMKSFNMVLKTLREIININVDSGLHLCEEINTLLKIIFRLDFKKSAQNRKIEIEKYMIINFKFFIRTLKAKKNHRDSVRVILDFQSIMQQSHHLLDYPQFQKYMSRYLKFCEEFLAKNKTKEETFKDIAQGFYTCLLNKSLSDKEKQKEEQVSWRANILKDWLSMLHPYATTTEQVKMLQGLAAQAFKNDFYKEHLPKYGELLNIFRS